MTFHQMLASLRKRSGMTMRQLAAAVGLSSPNSIWLWEHNERLPSLAQLGRFLDAVGATDEERLEALRLAGGPEQGGADEVLVDVDDVVFVPDSRVAEAEAALGLEGELALVGDGESFEACTPVSALLRRVG